MEQYILFQKLQNMKKSEVYDVVNELIQKNKQQSTIKDSTKPNFITNYYRQYLRKNKLNPRNRHYRIRQLMKNFEQLDTYVDVGSLMNQIQGKLIHENFSMEKKSLTKKQEDQRTHRPGRYWLQKSVTEPSDPIIKYEKTIRKAEQLLKNHYKSGNFLQLNKCNKIVQNIERQSTQMCNIKYKNNSGQIIYHDLVGDKYIQGKRPNISGLRKYPNGYHFIDVDEEHQEEISKQQKNFNQNQIKLKNDGDQQICADFDQKLLNLLNLKQNNHHSEGKAQNIVKQKPKINQIESSQLMRMASSVLHIILERQHKKKWAVSKNPSKQSSQNKIQIQIKPICKKLDEQDEENLQDKFVQAIKNQIFDSITEEKDGQKAIISKNNQKQNLIKIRRSMASDNGNKRTQNIKNQRKSMNFQTKFSSFVGQKKQQKKQQMNYIVQSFGPVKKQKHLIQNSQNKDRQEEIEARQSLNKNSLNLESRVGKEKKQLKRGTSNKSRNYIKNPQKIRKEHKFHTQIANKPTISSFLDNSISSFSKTIPFDEPQNLKESHHKTVKRDNIIEKKFNQSIRSVKSNIMQSFTFRNRKVKQKVLGKIDEFFIDMDFIQKKIVMQDKDCQQKLEELEKTIQFEFGRFTTEKMYDQDRALQGVKNILRNKQNNERLRKNNKNLTSTY